uniref:Putative ovule protein n=1 Tax=Solanum chacoense TaxID=4108 RepID=A0A0V0H798_SOLCH
MSRFINCSVKTIRSFYMKCLFVSNCFAFCIFCSSIRNSDIDLLTSFYGCGRDSICILQANKATSRPFCRGGTSFFVSTMSSSSRYDRLCKR